MRRALLFVGVLAQACSNGEDTPQCIAVDRSCTPAYEPTFTNLFERTLRPSCALAGSSCHASAGRKAGLVFETIDEAYASLRVRDRAKPGDPECSKIVVRTQSSEVSFMMPPGLSLPAAEKCAIVGWVAGGAAR